MRSWRHQQLHSTHLLLQSYDSRNRAKATLTDIRTHLPRRLGWVSPEAPGRLSVARRANSASVGADRDVTSRVIFVDDGDGSNGNRRGGVVNDCEDASLSQIGQRVRDAECANVVDINGHIGVDQQTGPRSEVGAREWWHRRW